MRVVRFRVHDTIHFGIVHKDGTHVMGLKADPLFSEPEPSGHVFSLDEVRLLSPVIPRSKVLCVGRNYAEHVRELDHEIPEEPLLFMKPNTAVIGPDDLIVHPSWSQRVDHEIELGVVIKTIVKDIAVKDVPTVIFGVLVANDFTARDCQQKDGQWTRAKGFDTSCPLGPWIDINPDLDLQNLTLECEVDGELRQQGNTKDMMWPVHELISYMSKVCTLLPGDVILTGTPHGVGPVKPGQIVTSRIAEIGEFSNRIVAAEATH
ncbi:MAG: fumarylacetoacetate hydrolase family protein [Actinomycetaceae bacterium]|nr:fumarylacetoacetate hydrolase family protein [Actinomycetaceae bacterium]